MILSEHDRAVKVLLDREISTKNVEEYYVDLPGEKQFEIGDEIPDIFLVYTNGREKIIEVDTRPMNENDKRQHKTFQRSAASKPNRKYEHHFASDVLRKEEGMSLDFNLPEFSM